MESWQQPRRLAGDHYRHTPSHLVNGTWALGEELADSRGPTPNGSNWLLHRLLGPAGWRASPTGHVWSRQAASAAGGSCRLLITVAVLLMTRA